jgi:hypothetical protein
MANPTPTPGEYKRDVGSGEQLDSGEATLENEDLAAGDQVEDQLQDKAIVQGVPMGRENELPVSYDDGEEPTYKPRDETEDIMFGPSEGLGKGLPPLLDKNSPVRRATIRALPRMAMVIKDPSTPPAVKAAYKYLLRMLEEESKNG